MLVQNIWWITAASTVAWALVYWLLLRLRLHIYWNKQWRGSLLLPPITSVCFWVVRILPYPLILSFFIYTAAQPRAGATPFFSFLGLLLFVVGTDIILSWRAHRKQRLLAGRDEKAYKAYDRSGQGDQSWIPFVGLLLLFFFGLGFLIIIGYVIWRAAQSRTAKSTAGKGSFRLEEDVPLHSEILRLGRSVGKVPKNIFIRARPKDAGLRKVPLIEPSEGTRPSIGNPVFPVENFIYVNPAAFTAALARRWAKEVKPESLYSMYSTAGGCITIVLVVLALSMAIPLLLAILSDNFKILPIAVIATVLIITAFVVRLVGLFRTQYEGLRDGLTLWSARKTEQDFVQQYVNALAEYHSFTYGIADAELVAHQFRINRHIRKLLRKYDINLEDALGALRRHLETDPVYPTVRERLLAADPASP